jgi:type IV secretory pathway TraG/TraD family ATPase VirD4
VGRDLLSERDAAKEELRRERTKQAGQVTWGDVRLPQEAETSHFLAVGTTGSGKSLTLGKLMRQALSSARPGSDIRALIYDPKQELMSFLAGLELEVPVLTLNAFDRRAAEWDMSADVTSPATALQIAATFIPQESGGSNPYFTDTARDLLTGVMLSFIESGAEWGLRDLVLTNENPSAARGSVVSDRDRERSTRSTFGRFSGIPRRAFDSSLEARTV